MNRNPGYRHLLLGAVCVLALSATMPIACAGQEDAPLGPPEDGQDAAPDKKDTGTPDTSKGGASGGGGTAGSTGKGGSSGSSGKGGSATGGKGGTGTGGKGGTSGSAGAGNSSGASGSSGSSGSPAYAVPAEGEPSCAAGQVFIFGTCFP